MNYQQMSFIKEQESQTGGLQSFQGASHASRIRLQETVKRLVTNVTYGRSIGESLAKLDQNGLWLRMYGDYFQARMDGSFEEYLGTLPTWGMMLDGVVTELPMSEQYTQESGLELLPTPVASEMWNSKLKSTQQNGTKHSMVLTDRLRLIPTPTASMWRGAAKSRYLGSKNYHGSYPQEALRTGENDAQYLNPSFAELMMGFPIKWTDLNV